ncbi:hypothetical protein FOA43_001216 [Brettanomyces nanus]|uniref:Uncharacterized protein n=1 Tax=Eeniella nana TaxID=13502 RepID=A0A875RWZ2_EENNA|nr:uncharacterized protein FOA43_001216 [Brettanomyces nanus]QPG73901.1 hypothetical protein FOA43_001216 [Brettanomyces nanus]
MFACGVSGFVYIVLYHRDWLNISFLKSLVITISHIYALTLALWLMAYGLVHLPRQIWENAGHYEERLQKAYIKLPALKEKMEDSKFELTDLSARIATLDGLDPPIEYRDWCLQLIRDVPDEFNTGSQHHSYTFATEDPLTTSDITRHTLHELSLKLHRLKWSYNHNLITYEQRIHETIRLEDEVNSKHLGELSYRDAGESRGHNAWLTRNSKYNYTWANYITPIGGTVLALCITLISVVVVESEIFHGIRISLIRLATNSITKHPAGVSIMAIMVVCIPFLTYMLVCALTSLFQVKIFDIYHVESNQSSDPVSLIFFVSYACRLTIPLSYNFLMLLDTDFAKESSFQKFLGGSIKLISLGKFLNDLLPRLVVIPMCLTFFHVWDKVRDKLRGNFLFDYLFDEFDFYDSDENDQDENQNQNQNQNQSQDQAQIHINNEDNIGVSRDISLAREGKQIVQQYVDDVDYNTPLRTFNITQRMVVVDEASDLETSNWLSQIGEGVKGLFSKLRLNTDGVDHLRTYNLLSGHEGGRIALDADDSRASRISSDSGISLSTTYDSDNAILPDEDIRNMGDEQR